MTLVTEFVLLGFPLNPRLQVLLFALFSIFYAFTLLGNGTIVGLIYLDSRLHTPMYFFLSHLAVVDIAYACNTVPQMLVNLLDPAKPISFAGCMTQTFLFLTFAITECLLLVVMSYDRYVAICHPLRYTAIMSWKVCSTMAGSLLGMVHMSLILRLPFCGPHEINHFFCEILSVLKLACADTTLNKVVIFAASVFILVGPLCLVLVSYARILMSVLKMQSGEGRRKAFSTCSSHLCVVGLFFGSAIVMYMAPKSQHPEEQQHPTTEEKIPFLFYSFFSPMLNPLLYSLRNAEVKGALRRAKGKEIQSQLV
ncbi:Olfactory receptor 2A1/2A42 [Lemmus lemmus]